MPSNIGKEMTCVMLLMLKDPCILSKPDSLLSHPVSAPKCWYTVCRLGRLHNICGGYNPFLNKRCHLFGEWCEVLPITIKHMLNRHHGDAVCRLLYLVLHMLTGFCIFYAEAVDGKDSSPRSVDDKTSLNGCVSQHPCWNASCWVLSFYLYTQASV